MSEQRGRGRPRGAGVIHPPDLLEGALKVIAVGGYHGLTVRGLARSYGVSLATVQHHFGTKRQLWQAAVTHYVNSISDMRVPEPDRTLTKRIRTALDASGQHPGLLAALLGDRSEGYEWRLEYLSRQLAPMLAEAAEDVAREEAAGNLRSFDNQVLQILIVVGIGAIAGAPEAVHKMFGYDLNAPAERAHLADALADIIGFGLYIGDADK